MSQQGPILVVSTAQRPSFAEALDVAKLFPVIEADWADAARAVDQVQPAAVVADCSEIDEAGFAALATRVAARQPYLPLIAIDPQIALPDNAIPFFQIQGHSDASDRAVARGAQSSRTACHRDAPAGVRRHRSPCPTSTSRAKRPCC